MLGAEAFRMALADLWAHKGRSILTILGVVIGVSSVLAVTSLGAAFEESIVSQFDDLDDRSIFVTASTGLPTQGPPSAGQFGLIFTEVDRHNLAAIDGVESVFASGQVTVSALSIGTQDLPFRTLTATTQDADEVRNVDQYATGGPFLDGEEEVVLGWAIASQFGDAEALTGQQITVTFEDGTERNATVAGVLAQQEALFGTQNGQVFVPLDPFYNVKRDSPATGETVRVYSGFTIVADDPRTVDDTRALVESYMEEQSDAAELLVEDLIILVSTPDDIQSGISSAFDQITIFIAAIAGVSLLVGGIMIATIMLISVAERTKEIGMMKAIGALDREVLWMFLLEAATIGFIGSMLGIGLGLGAGAALVEALFASGDDPVSFIVPWDWVGIAVVVGVGTGVLAGLMPARRATRIQPVEALGYE